jgi:hypothetical protein
MAKVVNEMGLASAKVRQILQYIKMIDLVLDSLYKYLYSKKIIQCILPQAQCLRSPITTYQKLATSNQTLYIMKEENSNKSVHL